ncbi:MAG TPA: hypothetical protein VGF14_02240 [Alphaproteobacteria bacterium]
MSATLFAENIAATQDWKTACEGDPKLISYLNSHVVHDEFCPRMPEADDIAWARQQLAQKASLPSFFEKDKTTILPAAPDGFTV